MKKKRLDGKLDDVIINESRIKNVNKLKSLPVFLFKNYHTLIRKRLNTILFNQNLFVLKL